jgi:hypothetical protein
VVVSLVTCCLGEDDDKKLGRSYWCLTWGVSPMSVLKIAPSCMPGSRQWVLGTEKKQQQQHCGERLTP